MLRRVTASDASAEVLSVWLPPAACGCGASGNFCAVCPAAEVQTAIANAAVNAACKPDRLKCNRLVTKIANLLEMADSKIQRFGPTTFL